MKLNIKEYELYSTSGMTSINQFYNNTSKEFQFNPDNSTSATKDKFDILEQI